MNSSLQTLRQVPSETPSRAGRWLITLNLAALALLTVGLARPQLGHSADNVQASGIDLIFALDVSGSMQALDFKLDGQPANRLDVAKSVVSKFIPIWAPSIAVEAARASDAVSGAAQTTSPPAEKGVANPAAMDLAPNKVEPGNFVSSLRPVVFAPWFITLQALPLMALAIVLLVHRSRRHHARGRRNAGKNAAEAAIREQLAAMDQALAASCAPAFFRAARTALQEQLAQRWKLPVSQVTIREINRQLNGNGEDLLTLFVFADEVVYSDQRVAAEDLKRWKNTVINHLKKLEDL